MENPKRIDFETLLGEMMNVLNPPVSSGEPAPIKSIRTCPRCGQKSSVWVAGFDGCAGCYIAAQHEGEPRQ